MPRPVHVLLKEYLPLARPVLRVGGQVIHLLATLHAAAQRIGIEEAPLHQFHAFAAQTVRVARRAPERPHGAASPNQLLNQLRADEAGGASDKNSRTCTHLANAVRSCARIIFIGGGA